MQNKNQPVIARSTATKQSIQKSCHSRTLLSGIYNACRCKIKGNSLLNRYVEDPRQKPSGMTSCVTTAHGFTARSGFTLIELLVVVLIIGILAAVAVPQYNTAIIKSRTASLLAVSKSIAEMQELYYLENGQYAGPISLLSIDIPLPCTRLSYAEYDNSLTAGEMLKCGNDFLLDNAARFNRVSLNYCPKHNSNWNECSNAREFQISFTGPKNSETYYINNRSCRVFNNSKIGKHICSNFAGFMGQDQNGNPL